MQGRASSQVNQFILARPPRLHAVCAHSFLAPLFQTHVLGPPQGNAGDALNVLQAELRDGLAGLLLVARVDGDRGARGDAGVTSNLIARLGAGVIVGDLGAGLLLGLVGELFDAGVGHFGVCGVDGGAVDVGVTRA